MAGSDSITLHDMTGNGQHEILINWTCSMDESFIPQLSKRGSTVTRNTIDRRGWLPICTGQAGASPVRTDSSEINKEERGNKTSFSRLKIFPTNFHFTFNDDITSFAATPSGRTTNSSLWHHIRSRQLATSLRSLVHCAR